MPLPSIASKGLRQLTSNARITKKTEPILTTFKCFNSFYHHEVLFGRLFICALRGVRRFLLGVWVLGDKLHIPCT